MHALKADRAGNVLIEGIVGVQKEVVLASKRSLVTVEEIVDDFGPRSPNAVILPSWTVGASPACRAARIRPTRTATTSATTPSTGLGHDRARPRQFPRLDEEPTCSSKGPEAFADARCASAAGDA